MAETDDDDLDTSSTGDLISVGLRPGFEAYDFALPFILREQEEEMEEIAIDPLALEPFGAFAVGKLKEMLGKGDRFHSEDVQERTRFGDYRVEGGVMTATGYNDYLARIVRRITEALSQPITESRGKYANASKFPFVQVNRAQLAEGMDSYVRERLFGSGFDPMDDENWRVLLIDTVADHIIKVWARAVLEADDNQIVAAPEVMHRHLSDVPKLPMRDSASVAVHKAIYFRLSFNVRSGGLEQAFIEICDRDASVDAFCKVSEQKHGFARLRYIKDDGLPAFYSPDFFVRTGEAIYLVETKAQGQLNTPNVQRKRRAAVAWCDRINALEAEHRGNLPWHYVLLGEQSFYDWKDKGGSVGELLAFAKLRPVSDATQARFAF